MATSADLMSDGFFSTSISSPGQNASLVSPPNSSTPGEPFALAQCEPQNLSRLLDAFAKSYYSAVMWDLNFDRSNAFANESTTEYLTDTINATTGNDTIVPDPILGSSDLIGKPAQFEIQYICSVPRKKDTGSLIISVLVADIVLLSVFWKFFNWAVLRYLRKRDPTWNLCRGCVQHSGARFTSHSNAMIWKMDQDPLCQNVDTDQETLYTKHSSQTSDGSLFDQQGRVGRSVRSKSSQGTLQTLNEGMVYSRKQGAQEYTCLV